MKTNKWLSLRKELFKHLQTQVRQRLGAEPVDLQKYRQEYEKEFAKSWKESHRDDLMRALFESKMILMGDFHALHQSQRAQLRLLKVFADASKPIVLCLECIPASQQNILDNYVSGKITESVFLKKIRWDEVWGFPFDHYRPLLELARKHGWAVVGLNLLTTKRTGVTLKKRDQFAAEVLEKAQREYPGSTFFVIYGDLHLAAGHLPGEILRKLGQNFKKQMVRVFQNSEKLYFRGLSRSPRHEMDVMRSGARDFCLLNVPPWVKWQNYLLFIESSVDFDLDDDGIDYTDHVERFVKIISSELKIDVQSGGFSVYTAADENFWDLLRSHFSKGALRTLQWQIEEGRSFYIPNLKCGYLARGSVNHAAVLAMQYLHAEVCELKRGSEVMPRDFTRLIWTEGIGYFGSKLINSKRKTDTLEDMRMNLSQEGGSSLIKDSLKLALFKKMTELSRGRVSKKVRLPKIKSQWSYWLAASYLGGLMGERLYEGYRRGKVGPTELKEILSLSIDSSDFEVNYSDMLELIESFPLAFKSKRERL